MKKKIIALCVCIAMLAIALIGGTMAYFTDKDEKTNVFAVGNIDIELSEEAKVLDKYGKELAGKIVATNDGYEYKNLMPTNKLVKTPTVKNVSSNSNAAYVRVTVDINNADKLNLAIDEYYESIPKTADEIQDIYDEVFEDWGINYNPRPNKDGNNDGRGIIDGLTIDDTLLGVDFTKTCMAGADYHHIFGLNNMFKTTEEAAAAAAGKYELFTNGKFDGYHTNGMNDMEIRYTYYLKLDAGEEFTLFKGLNVPADFDNNRKVGNRVIHQMDFFDGLNIEIKAYAIQAEGFDTAEEAFKALEAAHPMS